jgi:hypothetical protein
MTECSLARREVLKATGTVATCVVGSQKTAAGTAQGEDEEPDPGRVQVIAGFPDTGTLNTTVVLTTQDFASIKPAQPADEQSPTPRVPATLTDQAAQRYANVMQEGGFTNEGVGNCFFDESQHDGPREGEHCLYTVVDGEYVYGASMSPDLAQTINSGGFVERPRFLMQTGSFDQAQQLEAALREANEDINNSSNGDTDASDDNNSENNDSDNIDGLGPGFGVGGALTGLCGAGYLVKRRLDDEDSE